MFIIISCAKTMSVDNNVREVPLTTKPQFEKQALQNGAAMASYSVNELQKLLKVNTKIAEETKMRYFDFISGKASVSPALFAYTGAVFKRINPMNFDFDDCRYAQDHMMICSFLYGLLRPMDMISSYRLEGNVKLDINNETMFDFWKPILTDVLISETKKQGGVLLNLASDEMKDLFDWKKVKNEVKIITPEFKVLKDGKLKTIVIYT